MCEGAGPDENENFSGERNRIATNKQTKTKKNLFGANSVSP